jgi:hypothetical protein
LVERRKRGVVTNADLASALNSEFNLTGADAVTVNVIRQWVAWDVLPVWTRDSRALHRARRLARWRRDGVRGENTVIAHAFIEWGHRDMARVKMAIGQEFRRARRLMFKRLTTTADLSDFQSLSAVQKRALRKQAGPLDSRFAGTRFEQSPELYASLLNLARNGEGNAAHIERIIGEAQNRMLPDLPPNFPNAVAAGFKDAISGLFGDPSEIENAAQISIERASAKEFRIARIITHRHLKALATANHISELPELASGIRDLLNMLALIGPQISIGYWRTSGFVAALHWTIANKELSQN